MMVPFIFVALLLINSTYATYPEENYQLSDSSDPGYLYPDDFAEDGDYEVRKRSSDNFLRFGRNGNDYDDYVEDFARPTRSGKTEKNDHFIRFGRSKQDFLRFGRDSHRVQRANHLRFGRSTSASEEKPRNKRDTYENEMKRDRSNFLRFGRKKDNFVRFGRNNEMTVATTPEYDILNQQALEILAKLKQYPSSHLVNILTALLDNARRNSDVV